MYKTFITKIPDRPGSFLKPTRVLSQIGVNITRVSYNKSIDTNILFIEVNGTKEQIDEAQDKLSELGFLFQDTNSSNVILMEFKLKDEPGILLPILEIISQYHFNISYISSQENNSGYQFFKMALYIENPKNINDFLKQATKFCEVKIITYDKTEKNLDNTVFYLSFANELAEKLNLDKNKINELIENSNLVMQLLDEKNLSFYKTFEYIGKFGKDLAQYSSHNFNPRTTILNLKEAKLYIIEPPCGSNTYILEKNNKLMFIDSGFALYKKEMTNIFNVWFEDFEKMEKSIIITHPDIDHCGLLNLFNKIYVSSEAYQNFLFENKGESNFREQYLAHEPYVKISKILSKYVPPKMEKLVIVDNGNKETLGEIGKIEFEGTTFTLYHGNGGHSIGEVVITNDLGLIFTGDIIVNALDCLKEQEEFNKLAPCLMTSVNMNSTLAKQERELLKKMINDQIVCYGHGKPRW